MIRKDRLVPFIGLALVAVISLTGCSMKLGGDSSSPTPTASASASPSTDATTAADVQQDVNDAESSATLDETLWGHLTWEYPTRYTTLITKYYGEKAMVTEKDVTHPDFVVGSNLPGKTWTDSVRPPLSTKSIEEVYAHILMEPDYGWQVCSGLAHSSITDGKSLLELNPWLKECNDPAGINDWAQAAVDGSPADQLVAAKKLVLVVMLLEQLHNESVGENATSLNYHLVVGEEGGAMTVNPNNPDAIKEFELNPVQYKGEFVTVELTFKGQTGCWLKVGFNTGDGRFAGFTCETPKTTPPPTTTTTPGCTSNCGSTPTCKDTGTCTTTTCKDTGTCPTTCKTDCGNTPKSHDPKDYVYPTDKPKATVTTPAETTPPKVETTKPGGGGVVDTPTNKPGSETGTTSPGADPAPTTTSTPPPNEGGDN